jgi:sugar lactone lactonase YvrE
MNVELVVDARAELGEGPVWDCVLKRLYWVDIEGRTLHIYQPGGEADRAFSVGCRAGAVVPRAAGNLVLATEYGFEQFDLETGQRTRWADPEEHLPNNRFNDGKCDPRGRFWAGTMSMVGQAKAGSLYVLETDHCVRHVLGSVTTSNGLDWSPDRSTMYYIDTPTMIVRAFDYDADRGTITAERTVVRIPEGVGRPDGMTVDAEGMLWVAHWDGGRITRWNPTSGQLLATVLLPADRVTSCTFGGDRLDTLFVTTARHGLTPAQLDEQPHAGGLFALRPSVCGLPGSQYGG